jgi:hypothetical protein
MKADHLIADASIATVRLMQDPLELVKEILTDLFYPTTRDVEQILRNVLKDLIIRDGSDKVLFDGKWTDTWKNQ